MISSKRFTVLAAVAVALCGQVTPGWAGSIAGQVVGDDGRPLSRVDLCLVAPGSADECAMMRRSNRQGAFRFHGLTEEGEYTVRVFSDTSAANRRFEPYPSYVWTPVSQRVVLPDRRDHVQAEPILGEFNFSNFQRQLVLTAEDFPELAQFDTAVEHVALKVFVPPAEPGLPPDTIYLTQVRDPALLSIEVSLPLAATVLGYEVFSVSQAAQSEIILRAGR